MNKKILTGAEYIFLGLSALGTILAATTGQIVYATFPLIFSLLLNVVNREYLDKRISHNINNRIASVESSFSNLTQSRFAEIERAIALNKRKLNIVNQQLSETKKVFAHSVNRQELEQCLNDLSQTLASQFNDSLIRENNLVSSENLEQKIRTIASQTANELSSYIEQQIEKINCLIKDTRPEYQLVFDRQGSRDVLLKVLKEAKERIILVCPWINSYGASNEIIEYCRDFLESGGSIDIGWGHLNDIKQKKHIPISRQKFLEIARNEDFDWAYNQMEKLIKLEERYPKLRLKLLGTHEKFLVCDRSKAMIGSHNFLTSDCRSPERELGLITKDKNIIEDCIKRFEDAPSLDNIDSSNRKKPTRKTYAKKSLPIIRKTQSSQE